ncbi:MAG: helix-turn-helix domain-containing protein [Prevotella sp.]|jgi:transcriptional regulator with XRE-family HTH domain|nr:helix-turn-helix domain-containing protein [Prevotella sp.]
MDPVLYCRIKYLCEKNDVTPYRLEEKINLGNGIISKWKNGSSPSVDKVIKVANFFNVSTDYLLGISDVETSVEDIIEDKNIIALQRAREKMTPKDRVVMMQMLRLGFDYAFDDSDTHEG